MKKMKKRDTNAYTFFSAGNLLEKFKNYMIKEKFLINDWKVALMPFKDNECRLINIKNGIIITTKNKSHTINLLKDFTLLKLNDGNVKDDQMKQVKFYVFDMILKKQTELDIHMGAEDCIRLRLNTGEERIIHIYEPGKMRLVSMKNLENYIEKHKDIDLFSKQDLIAPDNNEEKEERIPDKETDYQEADTSSQSSSSNSSISNNDSFWSDDINKNWKEFLKELRKKNLLFNDKDDKYHAKVNEWVLVNVPKTTAIIAYYCHEKKQYESNYYYYHLEYIDFVTHKEVFNNKNFTVSDLENKLYVKLRELHSQNEEIVIIRTDQVRVIKDFQDEGTKQNYIQAN